ncbi:MAG: HAMP domain-containing histidine kinase [Alicyclobacillaceae bacterium]|nr:HAMP domain-containing histidine kinase [Alicyclobacillaceae bacterium]
MKRVVEIRYLLAALLCVFVPILGLEVWQSHRQPPHPGKAARAVLVAALAASACLAIVFRFPLSGGVQVDVSCVPLTLAFFTLNWMNALCVLATAVMFQLGLSVWVLQHTPGMTRVGATVWSMFPSALLVVAVYAAMMTACAQLTRHWRFGWRATAFIITLWLYTAIDDLYVIRPRPAPGLELAPVLWCIFIYTIAFLLSVRFVTAGRNALLRRQSEERMERLELISQFAASVAHEIRNPLTVVRGFAQLLLQHDYNRAQQAEFLHSMMDELDRAEAVIATYIQLASRQEGREPTQVELSRVVDAARELLGPYARCCGVQLVADVQPGVYLVANPADISHVVMTLVKNGIDAHDSPGRVDVRLRRTRRAVVLTVSDRGRGIPAARLPHVGQPHYATQTPDTGLELALVYKVVRESGGTVQIESREGEGTTFTISFPSASQVKRTPLRRTAVL